MELLAWALSAGFGADKLALIAVCSVAIYVLSSHLAWRLFVLGAGRRFVVAVGRSWLGEWLEQGMRLLYYVGIPAVAVWRAQAMQLLGVPPTWVSDGQSAFLHLVGLAGAAGVASIDTALLMWLGGLFLFVAVWVWYVRVGADHCGQVDAMPLWKALREALFCQTLWAFYRGVASTQSENAIYISFTGLALVVLAWGSSPLRRRDVLRSTTAYRVARDGLLLLFTVFATLSISSLALLVTMHGMWLWASDRILRFLAGRYACPVSFADAPDSG